ncbi:MAG: hypothetical protein E6916_04090 [Clostridium cochlearium]|uniref:hypothetical protein n=1 Tax=Clostridium cochlearium TaxID=1494 RepID=UPI00167BDFB1|nr:hypothetical protein [Clostridium cochlearium]MBU5268600.1 hypothetical protein [Clostridium cochlearium]MDU1442679.1 hypothetical protein [Clostridium cochlearium]
MNKLGKHCINLQCFCFNLNILISTYSSIKSQTLKVVNLMSGTEFEANCFSHQFFHHCDNNDIRRELVLMRRVEQQQQTMN